MRKLLALLAVIGAGVLIIWIAGSRAVSKTNVDTSWPPGDFVRQFPDRAENESATRLLATVERFGDDLRNVRHGEVGPIFLQKHANTIRTLRAQVISNPPPIWALQVDDILEPPSPPLGIQMRLFSVLSADALAQTNNAAAWADLHAVWILARSLWDRPEPMSITVALFGTRVICAGAARLQPPIPPWWSEVAAFDVRPPLLHSIEYEAWAMWQRAERYPVGESDGSDFDETIRRVVAPIARPIRAVQASFAVSKMHQIAIATAAGDPCEPFVIEKMPEWSGFVRRFNRFRVEREGVDKFLRRDTSPSSQCRNGRWTFDGKTLAFHGALPPTTSRMTMIPLSYSLSNTN